MKKKLFSVLLVLVLALSLCLMAAGPVGAAPPTDNPGKGPPADNPGKGAVKADLTYYIPGQSPGSVVGSVILNTTASGSLIVVIKIDDLPNLENYDVRVWINYPDVQPPYTFEDVLNTDADGYGNTQLKVNLPSSLTGTTIDVGVVLRPSFPGATPCYTTSWPAQVTVPLK